MSNNKNNNNKKPDNTGNNNNNLNMNSDNTVNSDNLNEGINLFANSNNDTIEVENIEAIPEYERVYDDEEIYRRDLENTFLSMYPISKQSTPYVKAQVKKSVDTVLNVRKLGNNNVDAEGNHYANEILNKKFSTKWIVPVVRDKFEVFSEIIDENYGENNILEVENSRNKDGIKVIDERMLLKKLSNIEENYNLKKLSLNQYLTEKYKLLRPYKFINSDVGYSVISQNDEQL